MHIYWFTGRSMKDLCATTQTSLASGLIERGYDLTFVNSDSELSHEEWPWQHRSIAFSTFPGRRSQSLGQNMKRWLKEQTLPKEAFALMDWRIAHILIPELKNRNIPWMLIDRSPPADKGILSILQWPSWRRSWKRVRDEKSGHGCVVSLKHREFVSRKTGVKQSQITILPAGVNLEQFTMAKRYDTLTMIYHGQLDKHRGVFALPMLLKKARTSGLNIQLILIGEGDCLDGLQAMAATNEYMTVYPSLEQKDLAVILSRCHIGLLPMPERKMWTIASPLKRSEYAASGLLIYGIDHAGHQFTTSEELDWMNLVSQEEFHDAGVKWLAYIQDSDFEALSRKSRLFAEQSLAWERTVEALGAAILSLSQ